MSRNTRAPRHTLSCRDCKQTVLRLLQAVAGEDGVIQQYDLSLSARVDGYRDTPWFGALSAIHAALQQYRQHQVFVRRERLDRVDYFLPGQKLVVEFDEAQHFTELRGIALAAYPVELPLGFDRVRWIRLCKSLNRKDNSPVFRDEQRAWLDTLRDFAGAILDYRPTVRLYAGDRRWCHLNPDDPADVECFRSTYFVGAQAQPRVLERSPAGDSGA